MQDNASKMAADLKARYRPEPEPEPVAAEAAPAPDAEPAPQDPDINELDEDTLARMLDDKDV